MEKLRQLRIDKGIKQHEIAAFLGIDRSTYTKYETGDRDPDTETLAKLASYFNTTSDYLLGRTDDPDPNIIVLKPVRFKQVREKFNHSPSYVANYLEISEEVYLKYENLEVMPEIDIFFAMANLFNTSISYLAGLTDNPEKISFDNKKIKRRQEVEDFLNELEKDPDLEDFFFTVGPDATLEGLQAFVKTLKKIKEKEFENK